jgi:hypothetical protein
VVRRKRPEMWTAESCLLHHDNAPAHTALSIRQFLAEYSIRTIPQPPIHATCCGFLQLFSLL